MYIPNVSQSITSRLPFDNLLNEHQVALFVGASVACLRRWRRFGQGPRYLKLTSGAIRYRPDDLQAWLDAQPAGGEITQRAINEPAPAEVRS